MNFKRDDEWQKILTEEQYRVLRQGEMEKAFSGTFLNNQASGQYLCISCNVPVFHSSAALNLNNGWLNFRDTYDILSVSERHPLRYGDPNRSITPGKAICHGCHAHLGLVLKDNAAVPYYFCINSIVLKFIPDS